MNESICSRRHGFVLCCLAGVFFAPACSNPDDPDAPAAKELPALSLMTFNVGLAPGLSPFVAERGARVIEAIAHKAEAEATAEPAGYQVLCAQEFWAEELWSALTAATAATFQNALRMAPIPGSSSCSQQELEPLGACLASNCDVPAEEVLACGQSACESEVAGVSGVCLPCVLDNAPFGFEQVAAACIGADVAAGEREPALYGGVVDVGLLTNAPVVASDSRELDSYLVRAGVLYANLDDGEDAGIHVFCTHLGSPLGALPYQGVHGSYEGEHAAQIAQLLAFIDEKTGGGDRVVLLGDLNTGPAAAGLAAELPEHFALLSPGAGFESPLLEQAPFCTWCSENSWLPDDVPSSMIDHILLRERHRAVVSGRPVFTAPVALEGLSEPVHLSDHFGAELNLSKH